MKVGVIGAVNTTAITIESLAKYRGSTVGFARAEAFMTIRTVVD